MALTTCKMRAMFLKELLPKKNRDKAVIIMCAGYLMRLKSDLPKRFDEEAGKIKGVLEQIDVGKADTDTFESHQSLCHSDKKNTPNA